MDTLHKKSVAALLIISASGIALFFYANKSGDQVLKEDPAKENLAIIAEQVKADQTTNEEFVPDLSGFEDLAKEAEELESFLSELE